MYPGPTCDPLQSTQRFRDEKPKAPEELLVDDFVTPRGFAAMTLHLQPHQIAQHGTGGFIAGLTGFQEPLPKLGINRERGVVHHHAPKLGKDRLTSPQQKSPALGGAS